MSVVVVGVGNRYRRDDGAGPEVARRVSAAAGDAVRVETTGDPSALVDMLAEASLAVVVDASAPMGEPGRIRVLNGADASALASVPQVSTHLMPVQQALGLAAALGRLPAMVRVVAVEGEDFGHGEGFSAAVTPAIDRAVEVVKEEAGCTSKR